MRASTPNEQACYDGVIFITFSPPHHQLPFLIFCIQSWVGAFLETVAKPLLLGRSTLQKTNMGKGDTLNSFALLIVSFLKFHVFRVGACTSCRNSLGNTPDLWLAQGAHPHIPFPFDFFCLILFKSMPEPMFKAFENRASIEIKKIRQGQKKQTSKPLLCRSTREYATLGQDYLMARRMENIKMLIDGCLFL